MKDVYNAAFAAISDSAAIERLRLKTNSREQEFLTGDVLDSDVAVFDGAELTRLPKEEKAFQIASITKTFTAGALVKMAEDPRYVDFFDKDDPIGTPIASFTDLVDKHGSENQKKYFAELKMLHPHYDKITLRHLLNHSSGVDCGSFFDEFRSDQTAPHHLSDFYSSPVVIEDGFEKFCYSDANYNYLLAPIMEAVASEGSGKRVGVCDVVRELVVAPLGLRRTFMADEMKYDAESNRVAVCDAAGVEVAQGYDYFADRSTSGQDFNYDMAAGGIYSTASEVAVFYKAMLSGEFFSAKESAIFFDAKNFIASENPSESYGLGVRRIGGGEAEYFHHGGAGLGFYSHVIGVRGCDGSGVKVASVLSSYDNLIRPVAAALIGDEKRDVKGRFFVDDALSDKMLELRSNYRVEELLAMRRDSDLIEKDFVEKSELFQKIYAEKYSKPSAALSARSVVKGDETLGVVNVR